MKKLLVATSAVALLTAGAIGTASAASISDQLGAGLIDIADDASGNFQNLSLNVANIDGSVNVTAAVETTTTYFSGGSAQITESTAGLGNLGDVATTAVGALNDGAVTLGQAGSDTSNSGSFSVDLSDVEYVEGVEDAASNIGDTSAASYAADYYVSVGSGSLSGEMVSSESFYGPMDGTLALNVAYNNNDIVNGSVNITGAGVSATGISTTVAGSINTGAITSGLPTN